MAEAGLAWNKLSQEEKQRYHDQSAEMKRQYLEYKKNYPEGNEEEGDEDELQQ